ncbi:MAG: MBL fold metallo-hydrolase [Alistipes sp.]|nr:MBL fold metallo-hydrolase [Alistipes sp.]
MNIKRLVFNPFRENTYLVWDDTLEAIIIDAGNMSEAENEHLRTVVEELGLKVVMAVNTHGHFDHTQGVMYVTKQFGAKFACSGEDKFLMASDSSATMYGLKCNPVPEIDIDLSKVESISFGNTTLRIIKTPGHTPGHVSLYNEAAKVLFTGDTLFRESIGRTDLPGGDYSWIMKSILEEIIPLGDDVKIYPGHEESSTIGHESLYNPFVTEVLNNEINYKG